jgi:hypothetical protein
VPSSTVVRVLWPIAARNQNGLTGLPTCRISTLLIERRNKGGRTSDDESPSLGLLLEHPVTRDAHVKTLCA